MNPMKEQLSQIGVKILTASRNDIYLSMRFFDIALSGLTYEMNLSTRTIGTDGFKILFNPGYLVSSYKEYPQDVNRVYVHMLLHNIFRHYSGRQQRDPELWNLACDIAVESMVDEFQAACVKRVITDERISWYYRLKKDIKVLNAESVYRWLVRAKLPFYEQQKAEKLFRWDDHAFWDSEDDDPSDQRQQRQKRRDKKWQDISEKTRTNLKTFSKDATDKAGDLLLQMDISLRERYDYKAFLKKFAVRNEEIRLDMDNFDYIFYTYGLNAYGNIPLIEPLEYRETEKIQELAIIVDTSESCSEELLRKFFGETFAILHQMDSFFKKINIHIIQCDADVQKDTAIHSMDDMKKYMKQLMVRGRGGTDFRKGLGYVNRLVGEGEFKNLKGVLYFTDGYGAFPKNKPPYDVAFIFVSEDGTDVKVPPWAMKVLLESDDIMSWSEADEH